jgi:hypothetical protein
MIFEDQSTKCRTCKKPLTWISHSKRWQGTTQIDEFSFQCESCNREYQYVNDKLHEKKQERDTIAETIAMLHSQKEEALSRRCFLCGGPINEQLSCKWCQQEYVFNEGHLMPHSPQEVRKPTLRELANAD